MKVIDTSLADAKIIEPRIFEDDRGYFYESFNQAAFNNLVGQDIRFVQDNHSSSRQYVLRGLHYQKGSYQGKLVRVSSGEIYDVIVDLRLDSPTFGRWEGHWLNAVNRRQLWVPEGFAHGFLAVCDQTEVLYKVTNYWSQAEERTICWNDETLAIEWPQVSLPVVSAKDAAGSTFDQAITELRKWGVAT